MSQESAIAGHVNISEERKIYFDNRRISKGDFRSDCINSSFPPNMSLVYGSRKFYLKDSKFLSLQKDIVANDQTTYWKGQPTL